MRPSVRARAGKARLGRKHDAAAQFVDGFIGGLAADLDHVGLGHVGAGTGELRHQIAVVGEQQQALAHVVEPADRKDPLLDSLEQIHDRGPPLRIADGGHGALRFIHGEIDVALGAAKQLALHSNLIDARVGLGARFGDDVPVDRDQAGGDQLFGFSPGGNSRRSQDLL